jgi:hypothetical protein
VQVVDHQRERLLEPLELGQESHQHHRACELRRRGSMTSSPAASPTAPIA